MQTLYSPNELAERWGYALNTIRKMEAEGKLHRLPGLPGVKYSAAEVYQLESIGPEAQGLTAWERRQKDDRIKELEELVEDLQGRLAKIVLMAQGIGPSQYDQNRR